MFFFKKNTNRGLKHAIIGCGHIAPSHVYGCSKNNVEIEMCYDIDKDKAIEFAKIHKIKQVSDSYLQILNDNSITSVSICTDHGSHAKLTLQALAAGKHVIVEKPIALTLNDAKKMIATAKRLKKVLSVVSQHRYNPLIIEIQKIIKNGVLGDITLINSSLSCHKEEDYYKKSNWRGTHTKEGGSTLINQAIHTLDVVLSIKNLPVKTKSFKEKLKFKKVIETEDTLSAIMQFKDKSLATFSCTNTTIGGWDSKIEVIGTKGKISFSVDYPVKILNFVHEKANTEAEILDLLNSKAERFIKPPSESYYGTKHREQMEDFFNVITKKSKKLFLEPVDALNTLSVVLSFYKQP